MTTGRVRRLANAPAALRARVDAKGRITLPKPLRLRLGLGPGTVLLLRADGDELRATTPRALFDAQRAARQALRRRLGDRDLP